MQGTTLCAQLDYGSLVGNGVSKQQQEGGHNNVSNVSDFFPPVF